MIQPKKLALAVASMSLALDHLNPYLTHACSYHKTDSPADDFCTCDYIQRVKSVQVALADLRAIIKDEIALIDGGPDGWRKTS